jgi:hypothetical protein
VNGDFDLATYKRGAFSSTQVNAATAATYNAPQPTGSTPIGYWVRLSNGCSSVDSDIAVIVPRPVAPTNVYVSVSGNSVTVAWNTLTGFAYRVERKVAGAAWTTAQGQTSSGSFTESPATPNGIAVYRVRALAGMAYLASNNLAVSDIVDNYHGVIANILNAGYEPLEVRVTKIKAAHVTQIRAAENALCAAIELPPPYTPPELDPNAIFHTPVNATHITSLMQYINSTRTLMGLQPVSFDTPVASHAVIKRDHIMSLRNALQ